MSLRTNNRIIRIGFILTYFGGVSTLAAFGFDTYGVIATNFILLPAAVIGLGMIGIAKLAAPQERVR